MNVIVAFFFCADALAARRMSSAMIPSSGTATATNPKAARRWVGAAKRKLATRSDIGIRPPIEVIGRIGKLLSPNSLPGTTTKVCPDAQ